MTDAPQPEEQEKAPTPVVGRQILCPRNSGLPTWKAVKDFAAKHGLTVRWIDSTLDELKQAGKTRQERLEELFRER